MATAINGILEALEKGVPVLWDGKASSSTKKCLKRILHPPEPPKESVN